MNSGSHPALQSASAQPHSRSLDALYRTTRIIRLRTRAHMALLAAEQRLTATAIAAIVRESEETVRCSLERYQAEGVEGVRD